MRLPRPPSGVIASTIFLVLVWNLTILVAKSQEQQNAFDPAKGFQSAQNDLVAVYLQIARSLEAYGSPEPYLRHMHAEHARIEAKYQRQTGDKQRSLSPPYMDATYFERFAANWKHLAPQLKLEALTKNTGHLMQSALIGPDGKGTMLQGVLRQHQQVFEAAITNKGKGQTPDFTSLQADLVRCLRFEAPPEQSGSSTATEQEARQPANEARAAFLKLFSALDAGLAPADAAKIKAMILSLVADVGRVAESEMQVASLERSLDDLHAPQIPYALEEETGLNTDERKALAKFLKKPRFIRADFPALDKFYKGPYDRLTERGKDEMSRRIHAGMQPSS